MPCFRCVWICERQYYQYRKISVDRLENQFDSQGDKSRLERERIEAYRRSFDFPDSHRCVPLFEARSRGEETASDRDRGKNCFLCSVRQCYYRKIFGRLSRVRIRQPRGEQTETEKIEAYRSSSSFPDSHRWCVLLSEARTCGEDTAAGIRDREEVLLHCSRSCLLKGFGKWSRLAVWRQKRFIELRYIRNSTLRKCQSAPGWKLHMSTWSISVLHVLAPGGCRRLKRARTSVSIHQLLW